MNHNTDRPNFKSRRLGRERLRLFPLVAVFLAIAACAIHTRKADYQKLPSKLINGAPYLHRIFPNPMALQSPQAQHWHVYIHGDGQAVTAVGTPSPDPTPYHSLLLPMAMADPVPALYIGRPCYFEPNDPLCNPSQWTLLRYSQSTLDSLITALQQSLPRDASFTLIGYSGGATLAALIAERMPRACGLVTLAGNLNVQLWLDHHDYSALQGLDPSQRQPQRKSLTQFHIAGEDDQEIHWQWIQAYSQRQPSSQFQILNATDHYQRWPNWWTLLPAATDFAAIECGILTFSPGE